MPKVIYTYDPLTGALIGADSADESPAEPGVFLIPADATEIVPPAVSPGHVAVFSSGAWVIAEDHRGATIYDQTTGAAMVANAPGPVPSGYALTPLPSTLAQAKTAQIQTITAGCEQQLAVITSQYPPSEIASWDSQYAEAVAWTANNASPTPLLSAIVAVNGATMGDQAASVLTKAAAFKAASGAAIGKRQKLTDQINAAPDVATVQAIVW